MKKSPLLFIVGFFVLLCLPAAQTLTNFAGSFSDVSENRKLAPAPTAATPLDKLPRIANDWYGDHFGFRSLLIKLKTQIDFSVFGMSNRVLVGRDGWLFYRSVVNVEKPAMETYLNRNLPNVIEGMRVFATALKKADIHLIVTVNKMSDVFYEDKLPASAPKPSPKPQINNLIAEIRRIPDIIYVDSEAILRETQKKRQIFHKTDFHWNDPAAYPVARAIFDVIEKGEGRSSTAWKHDLVIEEREESGGIAKFMPLFKLPSEQALQVKPTYAWSKGFRQSATEPSFEHVIWQDPDPALLSAKTVFVGDSFLDGILRSGIPAYFVESRRIRWNAKLKLSEIATALPDDTRWLVIQFIEISAAIGSFADVADSQAAAEILAQKYQKPSHAPN